MSSLIQRLATRASPVSRTKSQTQDSNRRERLNRPNSWPLDEAGWAKPDKVWANIPQTVRQFEFYSLASLVKWKKLIAKNSISQCSWHFVLSWLCCCSALLVAMLLLYFFSGFDYVVSIMVCCFFFIASFVLILLCWCVLICFVVESSDVQTLKPCLAPLDMHNTI